MAPATAITIIRECIARDRFETLRHFNDRIRERGLVWADVEAVVDRPSRVVDDGHDEYGRPRFLIRGRLADGLRAELVAVLDRIDAPLDRFHHRLL